MPPCRTSGKVSAPAQKLPLNPDFAVASRMARPAPRQHPWKVVHACELAREVLPLVQGQLAVGMRPYLLTPSGYGSARNFLENKTNETSGSISLLQAWNHVREWRKLLNESAAETSSEIVHAHSFASGMAAVRASSSVVYELRVPVEERAVAAGNCAENSWLARSFRAAEHFVLTRAAAVVVNNHHERLACLERGVGPENLFLIPEPIDSELFESTGDHKWLQQVGGGTVDTVYFLVPSLPGSSAWERRDALLRWMRMLSILRTEYSDVRLLFIADWQAATAIHQIAVACNLLPWITVLAPEMSDKAMSSADVVICDAEHAPDHFALKTLARGRALLVADIESHREITADGRGCLWFRPGEVADIAHRASFLASNHQFRRALATAGREHCLATRSAEVIGAQYDSVYRLAFSKRKGRDPSPPSTRLIPLHVGS